MSQESYMTWVKKTIVRILKHELRAFLEKKNYSGIKFCQQKNESKERTQEQRNPDEEIHGELESIEIRKED